MKTLKMKHLAVTNPGKARKCRINDISGAFRLLQASAKDIPWR
ncbi:hypothetical protein [Gellertiella hungarica]|uniref:Uncharacterized protein n=1 Tax=Gellertiella hungarica TaxID=1572859 RepID=A0A7W6J3P7_9HYPH|nr:hypothetical protein [Gellertiella hungarica]MBB4064200.1 hypothetical protein [Gellertiella hungarica]